MLRSSSEHDGEMRADRVRTPLPVRAFPRHMRWNSSTFYHSLGMVTPVPVLHIVYPCEKYISIVSKRFLCFCRCGAYALPARLVVTLTNYRHALSHRRKSRSASFLQIGLFSSVVFYKCFRAIPSLCAFQLAMDPYFEPLFGSIAIYDAKARRKVTENFYFDVNPDEIRRLVERRRSFTEATER